MRYQALRLFFKYTSCAIALAAISACSSRNQPLEATAAPPPPPPYYPQQPAPVPLPAVPTPEATPSQPPQASPAEVKEVNNAIRRIRRGRHGDIPPAQEVSSSGSGPPITTIKNNTRYWLSVYLKGAISRAIRLQAGASQDVRLVAGHYEEAARVSDPSVIPFYGLQDYAGGHGYDETFYIQTRFGP